MRSHALDAAEAWSWLLTCDEERGLLDRLRAVLWRLTHAPSIAKPDRRTRLDR